MGIHLHTVNFSRGKTDYLKILDTDCTREIDRVEIIFVFSNVLDIMPAGRVPAIISKILTCANLKFRLRTN